MEERSTNHNTAVAITLRWKAGRKVEGNDEDKNMIDVLDNLSTTDPPTCSDMKTDRRTADIQAGRQTDTDPPTW